MYMPIETSLNLLYEDFELINTAYKANVIIVGTSSLLVAIRLINQLFAQQKQNESINKIVSAGTNLYETFVQFCEDLIDVQKRFEGVSTQLNKTINRFKRGNKNKPSLFSQAEALKDYGINTIKEIPHDLTDELNKKTDSVDLNLEMSVEKGMQNTAETLLYGDQYFDGDHVDRIPWKRY